MDNLECGHKVLDLNCEGCKAYQKQWYRKLEQDPEWKDIEYGHNNPAMLYESVFREISEGQALYYESVWQVYHFWVEEGRRYRDLVLAELLATQFESTGTVRGIAKILKSKKLKSFSPASVDRTIQEINGLVAEYHKTGTISQSKKSKLTKP